MMNIILASICLAFFGLMFWLDIAISNIAKNIWDKEVKHLRSAQEFADSNGIVKTKITIDTPLFRPRSVIDIILRKPLIAR